MTITWNEIDVDRPVGDDLVEIDDLIESLRLDDAKHPHSHFAVAVAVLEAQRGHIVFLRNERERWGRWGEREAFLIARGKEALDLKDAAVRERDAALAELEAVRAEALTDKAIAGKKVAEVRANLVKLSTSASANIGAFRAKSAEAAKSTRSVLERCLTVLENMALEREGALFRRWPIHHEPLRADAKGLLPAVRTEITNLDPDAPRPTRNAGRRS